MSATTLSNRPAIGAPMQCLQQTQRKALAQRDSNARYCTLATLEEADLTQVRMRTLVIREITEESCLLFVNRQSQKRLSDLDNSNAEVLFFYPTLMSQFRLRGSLTLLSAQELEPHWQHKPYEAKLLDHFYTGFHAQSAAIADRDTLDQGIAELKLRYPDASGVPFIEDALGLVVNANYLEIWQACDSGIHDRRLYKRSAGEWQEAVLVP